MNFDAFISYSSKDKATADAACAALERAGVRCWIAPRDIMPGSDWGESIMDALDQCRVMILIFSTNANASPQIRREIERVVNRGIPLLPVRIEDIVPTKAMAYFMGPVHWLDALTPPLDSHLHRLAEVARSILQSDAKKRDDAIIVQPAESSAVERPPSSTVLPGERPSTLADTAAEQSRSPSDPARVAALAQPSSAVEEERRTSAEAKAPEDEDDRSRPEVDANRLEPAQAASAAVAGADTIGTMDRGPESSKPRKSSKRAVVTACALGVVLLGAGGVWLADVQRTPVPPRDTPVQAPTPPVPLSPQQEGALKPKDTFAECTNCPQMMVVPAGSFTMGSPASEAGSRDNEGPKHLDYEGPQHKVTLAKPLAVGKFSITRGEFAAFVGDTPYKVEGGCYAFSVSKWELQQGNSWRSPGFDQNDRHPVVCISWTDAKAYAAWLSGKTGKAYRLLSESEYEYAARAGTTTAYPWGSAIGENNANCNGCDSQWDNRQAKVSPTPVGSFPPNAFGLYDMHGNVYQWVEDCWHDSYSGAPTDGSAWTSGGCRYRVIRGGSWQNFPLDLRSATRSRGSAGERYFNHGFRVGRTFFTP